MNDLKPLRPPLSLAAKIFTTLFVFRRDEISFGEKLIVDVADGGITQRTHSSKGKESLFAKSPV